MILLLLAILSSAAISVIMRLSADKVGGNLSMLAMNYLVCLTLGAGYADLAIITPNVPGFPVSLGLGLFNGVLFLVSFMLLQYSTRKNGIVLSSVFMKLGLLVPIALSVFLFREYPTWLQLVGFLVAVAAIVVINLKKDNQEKHMGVGLLLLLLTGGSADAMAKVFEEVGPAALSDQFLFYTFASAFVLCVVLVVIKKQWPTKKALLFGAVIGVPNFFSTKFLLGALTELPAVVVYPTFSVATILVVTLVGVLVFREKLSKRQWAAVAAILAALVMLNT